MQLQRVSFVNTRASSGKSMENESKQRRNKEVDGIIEILGLKIGKNDDYPVYWNKTTKKAVSSIFTEDPRSELVKRGPVLLGGEKRELMMFTGGFLFARVDLDGFVRREVQDYFRSVGKRLNETGLDRLMDQYDADRDGAISPGGFEAMLCFMLGQGQPRPSPESNANAFSWKSLGERIRRALEGDSVPLKVDAAFRMADIRKIEHGSYKGNEPEVSAHAHFALSVHVKGAHDPLVVTCTRPKHAEAWKEAFRTRTESKKRASRSSVRRVKPLLERVKEDACISKESDEESADDSIELTDEEENDNAAWRLRLLDGSKFGRGYDPEKREREEMNAIAKYLALKNPKTKGHPSFLQLQLQSETEACNPKKTDPGRQITDNAINFIFFAEHWEPQSVLLKRGSVLLYGEERELMMFTNGFLFSHVELDAIVSRLMDDITPEQLCGRFDAIDTDKSGELDRGEITDFFQRMGMPLSVPALDRIMERYDLDSDGTISWPEFEAMTHELKSQKSFLRTRLRRLASFVAAQKLDVAFRTSDVEKIEHLGVCHSRKTRVFSDAEWAPLTLAVHIKGKNMPLLVTCAKPGHAEAWMEAFHASVTTLYSPSDARLGDRPPGRISIRDLRNRKERSKRTSTAPRYDSILDSDKSVDWGIDFEEFHTSLLQ